MTFYVIGLDYRGGRKQIKISTFHEYGGLLYRPMKKKVKGEGWLTGLSRYNE